MSQADATVENANGAWSVTETFNAPNSASKAQGLSAEFIMERVVEETDQNGNPKEYSPLLNFGTVQFTKCGAETAGGNQVNLAGGPKGEYKQVAIEELAIIDTQENLVPIAAANIVNSQTAQIVWKAAGSTTP